MNTGKDFSIINDRIHGCLVGGAVGDTLGYPVEFSSYASIISRYGKPGITRYELNRNGIAEISDDTQMTLFTANGCLLGMTRGCCRGIMGSLDGYCVHSYLDWLQTQELNGPKPVQWQASWLLDVPELYSRRAPGNTYLSALRAIKNDGEVSNNSCGCGGLMRIAPIPLICIRHGYDNGDLKEIAHVSARAAQITHRHPQGYISAAVLSNILCDILIGKVHCLKDLTQSVLSATDNISDTPGWAGECQKLKDRLTHACVLASTDRTDHQCISELGEGWIAQEALAISVFCALRHPDSFEDAVVAAVNHDGDSDSTGAICGNIMGALLGRNAIPEYYTKDLELLDIIEEMAEDLCTGCPISEYSPMTEPRHIQWEDKYCNGHRRGGIEFYQKEFEKYQNEG